MHAIARSLYAAAGRIAEAAASVAGGGGGKIRRSFAARQGAVERLARWGERHRDPTRPLLWMHAPSVGEGLQARPVLAELRRRRPELQLAYTYFSPSAVEFAERLDVDVREILPFDTERAARVILESVAPTALVFSKLDVWPVLAAESARVGVALGLISATLPEGSSRLRGFAPLVLRDAYAALDGVGAISDSDARRLVALGCRSDVVTVTGDTRFDQVWRRAASADRRGALLSPIAAPRPTVVAGSTWPADERVLLPAFLNARGELGGLRLIIAPHEPRAEHLSPIERWAAGAGLRAARLGSPDAATADVVIVDRVGVLGELYALADVAFVGGAFHGAGIHSVLEPAAYGAPVLFGPRHANSREAALLVGEGAARAVTDVEGLTVALHEWLADPRARAAAGQQARAFVERNLGATERSVALVERLLDRAATGR